MESIKSGAFQIWLRYYKKRYINDKMIYLLKAYEELSAMTQPDYLDYRTHMRASPSWLRSVREAKLLSAESASKRLGADRSTFSHLEKRELNGTISIKKLKQAAEALECDLVYGLIPKSGRTPAEEIWEAIYPYAIQVKFLKTAGAFQQMQGLATAARSIMESPEFRTKMGWSNKGRVSDSGIFRKFSRMDARKLLGIKKVFIEI